MCYLKIENLAFSYNKSKKPIISNFNLELNEGDILGLVGSCASGKSTLCRLILNLIPMQKKYYLDGKIFFNKLNIFSAGKGAIKDLRKNCRMIFQNPDATLNPAITIGKNLEGVQKLYKINKEEIINRLNNFGLIFDKIKYKLPSQLSGGEKRRLIIARALLTNPSFLIADEPFSNVDFSKRNQVIEIFNRYKKEKPNTTMIIITHDISLVPELCNKLVVMHYFDEKGNTACQKYNGFCEQTNILPSSNLNDLKEPCSRKLIESII